MPTPLTAALRERLQAAIRELAAQSANGKVRTRDVLDAFAGEPAVTKAHVGAEMYALNVEAQRGPRPGEGAGGRPKGTGAGLGGGTKFSPKRARAEELRAQGMSMRDIALEMGITKQAVSYLLSDGSKTKRKKSS